MPAALTRLSPSGPNSESGHAAGPGATTAVELLQAPPSSTGENFFLFCLFSIISRNQSG
jgi:hypothetical protein